MLKVQEMTVMSRFAVHRAVVEESAAKTPREKPRATEAEIQKWVEENREAFAAYDAYIDANGLFSDELRLF